MRRAAIVGTGAIATSHAEALRAAGDRVELVAVVDVDAERAGAFAEKWNVPRVHPGLAALLDEEQLDVVHVCTPPRSHVPLALECLAANVNVLVEKPPALSLSEIDTLIGYNGEYRPPENPDLVLDTETHGVDELSARIVATYAGQ